MKKFDLYIIKQFLGTFFFALALIVGIAVIFDLSEKMDDFIDKGAPFQAVLFDYYLNFIPWFASLFSNLFVFISVIFFTTKLAQNTEFVAMLSSGVSLRRILLPYFIAALIITAFTFTLGNYVIPHANKERFAFEQQYLKGKGIYYGKTNIHRQISPGFYVYLESFNKKRQVGYKPAFEFFKDNKLVSKLNADVMTWDSVTNKWVLQNYRIRNFRADKETLESGHRIDTTINLHPRDFDKDEKVVGELNQKELREYIEYQKLLGTPEIVYSEIEKHSRYATPFATFILTLIGVSLSARKSKGAMGINIGVGLLLSFTYILFMKFASMFAVSGTFTTAFAIWLPNIIYFIIGLLLYYNAPK